MNQTPFFSVVIPTKNRSHLIGYAVQSVLDQTFGDFEIILVDNDDTDATYQALQPFDDPRLRYCRTGGLSMSDNWNYGCLQARGEYLNVQADKHVLKKHALARIHQVVEPQRLPIVSWDHDIFNDLGDQGFLIQGQRTGQQRFISTEEIVTAFLTQTHARTQRLTPRGYNSATHRSILDKIAQCSPGQLILPVSPDYTLCFAQLAFSEGTLYIDDALFVTASRDSNGRLFRLKDNSTRSYIEDVGAQEHYDRVPVKSPTIICSAIFNDFLRARAVFGGNLIPFDLDPLIYFVNCYREVYDRAAQGVDMSPEMRAIKAALEQQPAEVQTAVEKQRTALKQQFAIESAKRHIRKIARSVGWYRLRGASLTPPVFPTFENILACVQQEE